LRFGHGMQMPPIELAELLTVLTQVEPQMSRQSNPVRIAFLDADPPALERQKDLRVGIRIECRLEANFEFTRIEIVLLHSTRSGVRANVTGCADLGIELRLVALPADESARRRGIRCLNRVAADCGGRCGAQGSQIRIGGGRWRRRASSTSKLGAARI